MSESTTFPIDPPDPPDAPPADPPVDDPPADERPKRRRTPSATPRRRRTANTKGDALRAGLEQAFKRCATMLDQRDPELSQVLREDAKAMADCLAMFGVRLAPLGRVLGLLVSIIEPLTAFGRVANLLRRRWLARRERLAQEWQDKQALEDAGRTMADRPDWRTDGSPGVPAG